jgi:hypothetical protein
VGVDKLEIESKLLKVDVVYLRLTLVELGSLESR